MRPSAEPEPTSRDGIAAALADRGHAVVPGFLGTDLASALREEAESLRLKGALREAPVGRGGGKRVLPEIRGDATLWLDPPHLTPAQSLYWGEMEALRAGLNRELFLGLFDLEAHLACYPAGAFYRAHLDCHRGVSARVVSAIVYLNRDWTRGDGGRLRLYTDRDAGTSGPSLEIVPEAGTLVLFLSADFWHEVLPARRERYSLTGWFRRRDSGPG